MLEARDSAAFLRRARLPCCLGILLAVVLLATLSPAAMAEDRPSERLEAHVFASPPRLDGDLSDWPGRGRHEAVLDSRRQVLESTKARWGGPKDASARVQVGIDAEALYLGVEVTDDAAFHPGLSWWEGDSLEVFLDLGHEMGAALPETYTEDCRQIFLMPRNPDQAWGVAYVGQRFVADHGGLRGVRIAHRERPGGYDFEARIPLSNLGLDGRGAAEIGFGLALNDADEGPRLPGTYLSWTGRFELYKRPTSFGLLALPERPAAFSAAKSADGATPWWPILLVVAAALAGILFLVGPGGRYIARLGPMPKAVGLALTGLLAVIILVDAARREESARERIEDSLGALAREADAVARDASALGIFASGDEAVSRRRLESLLRGERLPVVSQPDSLGFVQLRQATGEERTAFSLTEENTFHLDAGMVTRALALDVQLAEMLPDTENGTTVVRLGDLVLVGEGGASEARAVEVDGTRATPQRVDLAWPEAGRWDRLSWRPAPGAPRAVLRALLADPDGTEPTARLLAGRTAEGIPILGGPGGPRLVRRVPVEAEASFELPYVLGADRLWLVLSGLDAFPHTIREDVAARIRIEYDLGDPAETELRNGEHLVAERLPSDLERPPDTASREAYRWTDTRGLVHAHDAVALTLDPARRATRLVVENVGGAGALDLVAATLVRARRPSADSRIGLEPGGTDGADAAFVLHPDPAFAVRLGPGAAEAVRLDTIVGGETSATPLSLSAPLPADLSRQRARTEIALLTCLAIALILLAFLAADAVERFRRLTARLAFGVLVAALVPLGATMLLVDRSTSRRLGREHAARARTTLAGARATLGQAQRRLRVAAEGLAEHLAAEQGENEPGRVARLLRLYRGGLLPAGATAVALISGADRPTLRVLGSEDARPLLGPQFLAERSGRNGLHVSPWDGALLVGSARRGPDDGWVRVTLGVRVDDAFLTRTVLGGTGLPDAAVALLDPRGTPLAGMGESGAVLARGISHHGDVVRHELETARDAVLERLPATGGDVARLAVIQPLRAGEGEDEAPWLAVGLDRSGIERALRAQREQLAWLALFGVMLVVGVATLTARRVADPVRGLVRVTEAVRRGEFDVEVPPAGTDEVGDLTVAFDQMRLDLKHRVGDLDFLRRAQDALAGSLDLGRRATTVIELLQEAFSPDAALLLDAPSLHGVVSVLAEHGRRSRFADRSFTPAPGGWLRAAQSGTGPLEISAPAEDERVAAEGPIGRRLVEDRPAWLAMPLRVGGEPSALLVLAWDDPEDLPRGAARRLLGPLAGVCSLALHNARLYRLAALDDVTRLPGATPFSAALRADVEHAVAGGPKAIVLRIGLDHAEHVVRRRGVETGRRLLRALAIGLREVVGDLAKLGHLRENEFAVRLPGAERAEAAELAERIRVRLAAVEVVPEEGGEAAVSHVTIGLARAPDDATSFEFLVDAAGRALAAARREGGDRVEDVARLDDGLVDVPPYEEGAIFRSEKMVRVVEAARRAARSDSSVLITGETGTGKEVIANVVHRRSARAERPFVKVNCAAFPETLLESELFGHERGAFTGADRRREGRFELADGGTLFLDEIAEMSVGAQVKLLRVLQERQFNRLGGTRPVKVDVHIIAATNADLEESVADGSFREDLYYRLNVIRLDLPPLRERREEIPLFIDRFLAEALRRAGRSPKRLSSSAMDLLYRHPWPGNVRELKNVIERCAVLCEAEEVGAEHLRLDGGRGPSDPAPRAAPRDELNERQRKLLDHLARHGRCTNREYQELAGTSPRTGLRDLQDLMARGLLLREGKRRGAVYRLP